MKLRQRILRIFEPKHERARMEFRQALQAMAAQAEDMTRTIRLNEGELTRWIQRHDIAVNDQQQHVIFSTFAEICEWRGPMLLGVHVCRHKDNATSNGSSGQCLEAYCPFMQGKRDAA